ncbi:MAG: hypothetical protein RMJ81_10020 [Candidatus Kryptonium sp.]|nr:hypothetical protein [Candidatus Kryptonium sp.]MCX7761267.1 hypothetical protein [Candidatus Kryptonium sp.]MDW8109971.1 hypothetical protein [Candidatus Kryptonium sp.]
MKFTHHALKRIGMRRIEQNLIEIALRCGVSIYSAGAKFVFVRRKDIPDDLPAEMAEKINGLVLVLNPIDDTVITVYKNKNALKEIKRKLKRYDKSKYVSAPRRCFSLSEIF